MKTALYLISLLAFFSGCKQYQYASLSSDLPQNDEHEFVVSNDSLEIRYSFAGDGCPINIRVHNKLSSPLYVDWKKSALILNEQRFSYWTDEMSLAANTNGVSIQGYLQWATTYGTVSGSMVKHDQISFIPPYAYIIKSRIHLSAAFFDYVPKDQKGVSYFDEQDSPLKFRSFLTLSTNESFESPLYFDHQFWASELYQGSLPPPQAYLPDQIHNTKTEKGVTFIIIAIIAIPVLILAGMY